jgi:hypothetical protein
VRYEDKGWEGKMQKKRRGKTEEWTLNKKQRFQGVEHVFVKKVWWVQTRPLGVTLFNQRSLTLKDTDTSLICLIESMP